MPRTTLNIDATVLRELKRRQRRERKPLGDIASELLAHALAESHEGPALPPLKWKAGALQPKVDLDDKEALHRILDDRR